MNRDFLCERRVILGRTQISVQIILGAYNHRILGHRPATPSKLYKLSGRLHLVHLLVTFHSPVHPGLRCCCLSVAGSPGRSRVRGRLIPHTWRTESALRRETRPTMGDRRMVFGDGLEDIKVRGKSEKTTLSLKPRIVSLGRCRPMVEVVGEDSSLDLSSSDPFSCFGFLASQSHSLLSPRSERFYLCTVQVNLNIITQVR